jgi:hypothetical protein
VPVLSSRGKGHRGAVLASRILFVAAAALVVVALGFSAPAHASGGNPAAPGVLSSSSIVPAMLTAGGAQKSSGLTVEQHQSMAYYWVNNFNTSSASLSWTVTSDQTAAYNITELVAVSSAAVAFTVRDSVNGASVTATSHTYGWDRLAIGQLTIPAGTSTLTLTRNASDGAITWVKSLELIPTAQQSTYDQSVAASKQGQWLSNSGYGLFFQYGPWGNAPNGSNKSPLDQACGFNVANFVKMVQSTGASYVGWSYTWWTFQPDGPNSAIDTILGNPNPNNYTLPAGGTCPDGSSTDLDLKVAQALHAVGIKFWLYYHNGHTDTSDPNYAVNSTWWSKQNFPANYGLTGVGDKSTFLANWTSVITNIGNHFGTNLDGFFFDDASIYYPADFKYLEDVARTGNANRLVSWNDWQGFAYTQYEDFRADDSCNGFGPTAGLPVGSNGVYGSGPMAGIRAHCFDLLDQSWGVSGRYDGGAGTIALQQTVPRVEGDLNTATANHTTLSFTPMMYEDGSLDPATLALLQQVNRDYNEQIVNDTSSQITYSANNWSHSPNRGVGDIGNDVTYSSTTNATASITFTGTGIQVLGPTYPGSSSATVTLDGVNQGTYSENVGSGYLAAQVIFRASGLPPGSHTLVVTNTGSGAWFQIDGVRIVGG